MNETAASLLAHPWLMEPAALRGVGATLAAIRAGRIPEAARPGSRQSGDRKPAGDSTAFVGLYGPMTQRPDIFSKLFGWASTEVIGQQFDALAADPKVGTIILEVDSPGGSVFGVAELGAKVAAAAKVKKVTAVVNSVAASAAYWIASQANEIVVTPGGLVGSIGVYLIHVDESESLNQDGVKVTLVSAGQLKTAGNSFEPLSDAGRQQMQDQVNYFYGAFVSAVAAGRRVSTGAVRAGFGKGGVVTAADAVAAGMADRVGTLDAVLSQYGVSFSGHPPLAADPTPRPVASSKPVDFGIEIRKRRLKLDMDDAADMKRTHEQQIAAAGKLPPAPPPMSLPDRQQVWGIAYHEAGHAVAGHALNGTVGTVTIEPDPTAGTWGHATVTGLSDPDKLAMLYAGHEAQRLLAGRISECELSAFAAGDKRLADAITTDPAAHDRAKLRAGLLVQLNKPKVENLAKSLLARRTLSGVEAVAAMKC